MEQAPRVGPEDKRQPLWDSSPLGQAPGSCQRAHREAGGFWEGSSWAQGRFPASQEGMCCSEGSWSRVARTRYDHLKSRRFQTLNIHPGTRRHGSSRAHTPRAESGKEVSSPWVTVGTEAQSTLGLARGRVGVLGESGNPGSSGPIETGDEGVRVWGPNLTGERCIWGSRVSWEG